MLLYQKGQSFHPALLSINLSFALRLARGLPLEFSRFEYHQAASCEPPRAICRKPPQSGE
jgi:hypothetical protein